MATNPTFSLSLLAFPQSWDGTHLNLRMLIMPQGDPLNPLFTNVPPAPDSPAFADAKPKFVAELIPSLKALPSPAGGTSRITLTTTPPAQARPLFQQLTAQFDIVPDPPGQTPRRAGYSISKYLPESYTSAFNFDSPSTPFAVTDDTYHCMLENLQGTQQPPPPSTVSWGRIIGFALRQPLLAAALGLLYEASIPLPSPGFYANGGWLYLGLDPASDFAAQIAVDPALMQPYAARIPALTTARPLFAAVLFPVLSTPPADSYDDAFVEAEEYDDGFVKIVHGSQPATAALLDTDPGALPPSADFGLRLGWDDEQVTTWFNRQVDATQIDAPFGTAGYRIDARAQGSTAWHSMCAVTGAMTLGPTALGTFNGELSVETVPAGLDPTQPTQWWLPSYFAQWLGRSVVTADPTALTLHGDSNPSAGQPYTPVGDTAVPLRYGQSYDFRVRMTDLSRGGPAVTDSAVNPGAAPIGTMPFRRFVPFQPVTIANLNQTATPAAPQTMYEIARPLLNYPAAVFAGIPNAAAELLADLPAAAAAGREAALPDPDAVQLSIEVQVRQLADDAAIFVPSDNDYAPYSLLYQTTRAFPADPAQSLQLTVTFQDVPDIGAFPAQPATGTLVLPRARDIRLVFRAAGKADSQLLYWGSAGAATGPAVEVLTGANGADERAIFVPGIAATRIQGIMLQPDPVQTSNFIAVQALLGQPGSTTSDLASRLANALSLSVSGLSYTGQPGERVAFGCSAALRNTLSPEHAAITFAAKAELTQHWLIVISLRLARDWSWSSLGEASFQVSNSAGQVVGSIGLTESAGATARQDPDRGTTTLIFFDAVDPKPAAGAFPAELKLTYTVTPVFATAPARQDPPLQLPLVLPIAANPLQTPQLVSAGTALTPYTPAADYSATAPRKRAVWFEFAEPLADPEDMYFARVLSYAPDQMLTGAPFAGPAGIDPPSEPPLPVDPELIRTIVPGQSDDKAGLAAMQPMIASSSPVHFMLPLPTGLAVDAPELFGMFSYEFRVGHLQDWSTAQGRFGPPLRVAGVQHPAPPLLGTVSSQPASIGVAAPYATPVFAGRNLLPAPPRTQIWVLLYAQVTQADRASQRNVLLDRRLLTAEGLHTRPALPPGMAGALWERTDVEAVLASLALSASSPLSVLVVEMLPDTGGAADPLGADLGQVRILRTSPLTAVPAIC